jgi:hypothetical protein
MHDRIHFLLLIVEVAERGVIDAVGLWKCVDTRQVCLFYIKIH